MTQRPAHPERRRAGSSEGRPARVPGTSAPSGREDPRPLFYSWQDLGQGSKRHLRQTRNYKPSARRFAQTKGISLRRSSWDPPRGRNLLPPPKHKLSLDRFVGSRSTPLQGGPHPLLISDHTQRDLANNARFVSSHWRVRLPSPQGGGRTHAGPFYAILCPRTSSVGTTKIAVAPGPCPQSFRPFGHLLWYLFARGSHSPRATASAPPVLGDMEARA